MLKWYCVLVNVIGHIYTILECLQMQTRMHMHMYMCTHTCNMKHLTVHLQQINGEVASYKSQVVCATKISLSHLHNIWLRWNVQHKIKIMQINRSCEECTDHIPFDITGSGTNAYACHYKYLMANLVQNLPFR